MTASVLVVEDHRLLAQSVAAWLGTTGMAVTVVDVPATSDDQIVDLGRTVDVVLLDLELGRGPDGLSRNGSDLIEPLCRAGAKVVILTGSTDLARWGCCLMAGAATVVAKTERLEQVADTVRNVHDGSLWPPQPWRARAVVAWQEQRRRRADLFTALQRLTPREAAVLADLAEGRTVVEIATHDVVTEATVRSQVKAVLRKLDVCSQLQAVALLHRAQDAGWARTDHPSDAAGGRLRTG